MIFAKKTIKMTRNGNNPLCKGGADFEGMKWHQEFPNTIETRFFLLDRI